MSITWHRLRTAVSLLAVAGACLAYAERSSAGPAGLQGHFAIHFPKGHEQSNAPCPPDEFCGVGQLIGYGKATITILEDSFTEIPESPCFSVTALEAIEPLSGVGGLVLNGVGTFCPPGHSGDSNAGPSSYGHPGHERLTYTVLGDESWGIFAAATGTGALDFNSAGGVGDWRVDGDLELAR
jgi:hypothetical protein